MKGKTNSHKPDTYIPSEIVTINVSGDSTPQDFELSIDTYSEVDTSFTQLEYIESTGDQYIDTNLYGNQDTKVIIDATVVGVISNDYAQVFGSYTANTTTSLTIAAITSSVNSRFGNVTKTGVFKGNIGERHVYETSKINAKMDGIVTTTWGSVSNFTTSSTMYIARTNGSSVTSKIRVYSCKIYDKDILIRDYIPAKDSQGNIGLYDKVNRVFTQSGSGTNFIGGLEIATIKEYSNQSQHFSTQTTLMASYKIPIGTKYVITPSKEQGYKAEVQTFIASQVKRNVNIVYEVIEYGAFIMDASGNIGNVNDWTSAKGVTGVVLITPESEFVIAPEEWCTTDGSDYDGAWNGNTKSAWGGYGKTVTGIKTATSKSDAITDFAGSANTDAIISQLKGTTDDYSSYYTGAPAAEYCRAYSNGCKGAGQWYLPAAGEMNQIGLNKAAIEEALTAISGELFSSPGHEWTSTQYSSGSSWYYHRNEENFYLGDKYYSNIGVRPVCKIEDTTRNIITFKLGNTSYLGENQMTWQDWINSSYNTRGYKNTNNYLCTSSGVQVKFNNSPVSITSLITPSGNYISSSCTVVLNSQWRASSKSNPNSSLYSIYESYSNYNVNSGTAIMYIDIVGYTEFTCYVRSYGESCCDYVMISQLDKTISGSTSYTNSLVKAHTANNSVSGTALSNYTKVTYSGIDGGSHRITVVYRKDGSVHSGDDRGYILIPK